jgi:hypothetical protein
MPRTIVAISVLALALAGCGGDKKSNRDKAYKPPAKPATTASGGSSAQAEQQDAAARTNARDLLTEVEVCYVDSGSYAGCEKPAGTKLKIGSGAGQVEVTKADATTYTVVAHSESGTDFTVAKGADGAAKRTCDKPGKVGCKVGGTW